MSVFSGFIGFDWDEGNKSKSYFKHGVSWLECEQVFLNEPLFTLPDPSHSRQEDRCYALGRTNQNRLLFVVFTRRRKDLIRVISARPMNRKERSIYYAKAKAAS